MKNVVLIGMPGSGKSTVGVLLAKSLVMSFVDTDLLIQRKFSKSLCDIIEADGVDAFIEKENGVIAETEFENSVIATGGSAVYGKEAMQKLKGNSVVVYLKVDCRELEKRINNIHTRGIAMKDGTTVSQLYSLRAGLYERYADFTLDCTSLSPEECVEKISIVLKNKI